MTHGKVYTVREARKATHGPQGIVLVAHDDGNIGVRLAKRFELFEPIEPVPVTLAGSEEYEAIMEMQERLEWPS